MKKVEAALLSVARKHPGRSLREIDRRGDLPWAYDTLRHAVASLRRRGHLYPARPCWVILAPGYQKRLHGVFRSLPDWLGEACSELVVQVAAAGGAVEKAELFGSLTITGEPAQKALEALRRGRVVHPWDGLVCRPDDERAA